MPTLQFKRGIEAGIPTLASGEPGWTTDTHKLFVGTGSGNVEITGGGGLTSPVAWADIDGIGTLDTETPTASDYVLVGIMGVHGNATIGSVLDQITDTQIIAALGYTPTDGTGYAVTGGPNTFTNAQEFEAGFFAGTANQFVCGNDGSVITTGGITADTFTGDGSGLGDLNASNLGSGTIPDARLPADLAALEALTGTDTIYYRSAANTWTAVTVGTGLSFSGGTLTATGSGVADGDYGDVTVSGTGAAFTIDNNVVTFAKMQDVGAASRLIGRGSAAGAGDPQEITLGTGLSMSGTVLSGTGGTVTSVSGSGGTTGLTLTGGAITTSGTLTIGGTLAVANGGTGSTSASAARTALGLGTSATVNTGTSGATIPLLNGTNTWGATQTIPTLKVSGLTSGRVPYVTTGGQLTDVSTFTFDGMQLAASSFAGSGYALTSLPASELTGTVAAAAGGTGVTSLPLPPQGRLTLTSGTAVTSSDVTGATTIYYTPATGSVVYLYDGTRWSPATFTERSLSLGTLTSGKNYDVFLYDVSGTLTLKLGPAWTSDTARGTGAGTTELELVNGLWVNKVSITSGPAAQRGLYLGTLRTTSTTATGDSSAGLRLLWNAYNRVPRPMRVTDSTSHSYGTGTFREWNNVTTYRLQFVCGLALDGVDASGALGFTCGTGITSAGGLKLDATTSTDAQIALSNTAAYLETGRARHYPPQLGYHYVAMTEFSSGGSTTFSTMSLDATVMG